MAIEEPSPRVRRLARFGLNTGNAEQLARFYSRAFDCTVTSKPRRRGARFEQMMGVRGGAKCLSLALGESSIEILEFDDPGRPYPGVLSPSNRAFQHFAIVVADMRQAFERLSREGGWSPISAAGPQELPGGAGSVTAFKFRDPDGHPLELLSYAAHKIPMHWQGKPKSVLYLGIDHSAISIADTRRSIAFYEDLGLKVAAKTLNRGIEQQLLDGIPDPEVEVIALAPTDASPHVELLNYKSAPHLQNEALRGNDIGATRLIFQAEFPLPGNEFQLPDVIIRDPDGHRLHIVARTD